MTPSPPTGAADRRAHPPATNSLMSHPIRNLRTRNAPSILVSLSLGAAASLPCGFGFVRTAAAEPSPPASSVGAEQCLAAYSEGQRARKGGEFGKARALLAQCGGASCPAALHGDCQRWLAEVESATPRSVFRVLSPSGDEIEGVQLAVDDAPHRPLDGRAIQFDPGEHWLEFQAPGFQKLRQKQSFVEGEPLVIRTVHLQPLAGGEQVAAPKTSPQGGARAASLPAPEAATGSTNLPIWLGVGAGAVGAAGFSYFGLEARRDEKALGSCSPDCADERVEGVEREYLLANVSLGIGVVGLLGAAAWLVFRPGQPASNDATAAGCELRVHSNSATLFGRF